MSVCYHDFFENKHLEEAKEFVRSFISTCGENEIFSDKTFEISTEAHGWNKNKILFTYSQIKKFYKNELAISTDPKPAQALQGILGDFCLFGVLMTLAKRPKLLKQIIPESCCSLKHGYFHVRLYLYDIPRLMLVDGHFPGEPFSYFLLGHVFKDEMWASLIEKAMAKFVNGYDNLRFLKCSSAFRLLTGANCVFFPFNEKTNLDFLWKKMLDFQSSSFLMTASTERKSDSTWTKSNGLIDGITYSIIDTRLHEGKHRLVLLGIPGIGEGEYVGRWKGKWADLPVPETFIPKKVSDEEEPDFEKRYFWMEISAFCELFQGITVCRYREGWSAIVYDPVKGDRGTESILRLNVNTRCTLTLEIIHPPPQIDNKQSTGLLNIHHSNPKHKIGKLWRSIARQETTEERGFETEPMEFEPGEYVFINSNTSEKTTPTYSYIIRSPMPFKEKQLGCSTLWTKPKVVHSSLLSLMNGKTGRDVKDGIFVRDYSKGNSVLVMAENKTKKRIGICIIAAGNSEEIYSDEIQIHPATINNYFYMGPETACVLGAIYSKRKLEMREQKKLKCSYKIKVIEGEELKKEEKLSPFDNKRFPPIRLSELPVL
ncbi:unnamed protein product [Caenorhabditis nigoni]